MSRKPNTDTSGTPLFTFTAEGGREPMQLKGRGLKQFHREKSEPVKRNEEKLLLRMASMLVL